MKDYTINYKERGNNKQLFETVVTAKNKKEALKLQRQELKDTNYVVVE